MKYIAVLDTDDIEDFAFFEDGKEKYLHGIDANSENGEIYLPFKPLKREPILPLLDKIRAEIEDLDIFYDNDYFSSNKDAMFKCSDVLQIIDKYKTENR